MIVKNTMAAPRTGGKMQIENIGISDDPEDQMMILNILTKSVYTDPLAAVLREYGCNAADANVEAGKGDQPIEVRLPNKLDPTLSIRDFGLGMTQDQVVNTFCRLGKSTKRSSNAFTGMLGIGSKAGFAYGDQFMVTSYSGGTKTIYNLYRDKGMPKLALMHEEKSDAPDGIEVKVPVREEDIAEFATKAERVYRYFKVRPIIHGQKVEWGNREQEFSGTGWRFLGSSQKSVAIMGNVGYSIDAVALGVMMPTSPTYYVPRHTSPEASLIGLGVELDFNIGDLEIAASREGLQYDDPTKQALNSRLQVVIAEIGATLTGKIAAAPSMWEAKKMFHSLFDGLNSNSTYELNRVVGSKITWKGIAINSAMIDIDHNDLDVNVTRYTRRGRTGLGAIRMHCWTHPHEIEASDMITLVINDLKSGKNAPARMRGHFDRTTSCHDIFVFHFNTQVAQDKYWKDKLLTGAPTVILSSIAPQIIARVGGTPGPSAHKSKHSAKVFVLDEAEPAPLNGKSQCKSNWWDTVEVDIKTDGGVYVRIENFLVRPPSFGCSYQSPWYFSEEVKALRGAGMITGPVYGFKADRIAKLGPKWVPLADSLKARLDTLVAKDGFAQEVADFIAVSAYKPLLPDSAVRLFPDGTSVRKLLEEQCRMRKPRQKKLMEVLDREEAMNWLVKPTIPAASVDLNALEKVVIADYPMIGLAASHIRDTNELNVLKQIACYVKQVDAK